LSRINISTKKTLKPLCRRSLEKPLKV